MQLTQCLLQDVHGGTKPHINAQRCLSISAGFLFPYFVGVADALVAHGIITETSPIAGSSAGSLIAAAIKSRIPLQKLIDSTLVLARDCR